MKKERLLNYYSWFVIAVGAGCVAYCVYNIPADALNWKFAVLALLTMIISGRLYVNIPHQTGHITVSETFIFMVMMLYGGESAVIVAAAEGVYASLPYRRPRTLAFNGSVMAISTLLTAEVLTLTFGPITGLPGTQNLGTLVAAVCLMALVQYSMNTLLVAVFTALKRGQDVAQVWKQYYLWTSITHLAGASAAGLISRVVVRFRPLYVLLTTTIVLLIFLTFKPYL